MRRNGVLWFFAALIIVLDSYVFQIVRFLASSQSPKTKIIIYSCYWLVTVLSLVTLFAAPYFYQNAKTRPYSFMMFSFIMGFIILKVIIAAFMLIDDIRRLFTWGAKATNIITTDTDDNKISRSAFLSWLGVGVGTTIFSTMLMGMTNRYNYKTRNIKLSFPNLPNAFKGLKIVQISDIHSGSFTDKEAVNLGVQKINDLQPDLILFTGDLVNDTADEIEPYKDIFAKLKAPLGVYSVLGNHDYGDYYAWPDRDESYEKKQHDAWVNYKAELEKDDTIPPTIREGLIKSYRLYSPLQSQNLEKLKAVQAEMGWKLLMNENAILDKNGEKIALIGIENWGARGRFPKYGRLDLAHPGTENIPFKILMSHDPSHWNAQITKEYQDINLTLAGHTHGMQFGLEIPNFKWSPVQYMYKQWAGIYEQEKQKLYVNRGFGFLGYSGRVGIMPEITLIELS